MTLELITLPAQRLSDKINKPFGQSVPEDVVDLATGASQRARQASMMRHPSYLAQQQRLADWVGSHGMVTELREGVVWAVLVSVTDSGVEREWEPVGTTMAHAKEWLGY